MGSVILFAIICAAVFGWGWNIVRLAQSESLTGMSVLRTIGIFAFPLGCVLGFISNVTKGD